MKLDLSNLSNIQSRPVTNEDLKNFPTDELDQLSVLRDDEQHSKTHVDEEVDKVIDMSDIKTEVVEIFPDTSSDELPTKQNWSSQRTRRRISRRNRTTRVNQTSIYLERSI